MSTPIHGRLSKSTLELTGPPPGRSGRYSTWLTGQPEGWERLSAELDLGPPGSTPPTQILAELCHRLGPERALHRLEGDWNAILAEGSDTLTPEVLLVRGRLGGQGWWLRTEPDGSIRFADHPRHLPGARPSLDGDPWPGIEALPAGCLRSLKSSTPRRWWQPGHPPPGRAGSRAIWDRSAEQALVLGIVRAAGKEPFFLLDTGAPADRFLQERLPRRPEGILTRSADPERILRERVPLLPLPRLEAPARQVLEALDAAPAGSTLLCSIGAGPILGEGLPRLGLQGPWSRYIEHTLPEGILLPLGALAGDRRLRPALVHPAVIEVAARIPALHLRGLRGSLSGRLGLASSPRDPWADWLEGPGRDLVQEMHRRLPELGPPPEQPARRANWLVRAAWYAGQG